MTTPMKIHVIVKTHELALKGKNRPWFMRHLVNNLRKATRGTGVSKVWQGHMLVGLSLRDESSWPEVRDCVRECFGVAKFFKAYEVPLDLDKVKEVLPDLLSDRHFQSFRISANRADKRFPVTSEEINRDLGTFVKDLSGARVDLNNPELEVFIDVLASGILLYFEEVRGHGGLPVGVSGDVMTMLSGGIDSPVAAWQMMKRGCRSHFTHFHSYPLVDRSSIEKAMDLTDHLTQHQFTSSLALVPLGDIQKQIIVATPPAFRVILYRRFMVRITEVLARRHGAKAIITGESCGQVSSQTLDNIAVIDAVANMPVLRPLIGQNKEEIVNLSRRMGTFPISIQPDQDCCSLFVPKHPETHARLETVLKMESSLAVDELVEAAVAGTELREFSAVHSESQVV